MQNTRKINKDYLFLGLGCLLLLVGIIFSYSADAQQKNLTIDEAVLGAGGKLIPKNAEQLQWVQGSSLYSQGIDGVALQLMDAKTGKVVQKINLSQINSSLSKSLGNIDTLKRLPKVTWINANTFRYNHNNSIIAYNLVDKSSKKLANFNVAEMENAEIEPKTFKVAYTVNHNVFIDGKQITFDTKSCLVNGETVHRNEFGITKGLFWNNDGNQLAFYHMDECVVPEYPIYQLHNRPADARTIRYPIAGTPSHTVTVGVYNVTTAATVFLKTGLPAEQYLTNVCWSPDNKYIFIAIVNSAQNHMWLNQYNANTGDFVKTLFEETDERYVEPQHAMVFVKNNPNQFVWWSERDGYNHLYLYDISGQLIRQLTKGNWVVTEVNGFDKTGNTLFYTSTISSPTERQFSSVNIKTGVSTQLTTVAGTHSVLLSSEGDYFIDHLQNINTPREISVVSANGKKRTNILTAPNPLVDYNIGSTEIGSLVNSDGVQLYYRIIKPAGFDANKKYPVVVYLYNGPHIQLVNNTWLGGGNLWMQYMAQKGYVVFTIDGRGSMNRGHAFESAVFRQLGTLEMADQMAGVNYLKTLPYIDGNRMGIHGWSFGGFMTTTMMTRQPGTFKVGVAGGPVIDWGLYEIMYTERYMDTPEENPEGYKTANLLNYIKDLKGNLLMIHGGEDAVVLWQHSLFYVENDIKENVQMDYFVYPHHPHNVSGKDRVHLMDKISRYLIANI